MKWIENDIKKTDNTVKNFYNCNVDVFDHSSFRLGSGQKIIGIVRTFLIWRIVNARWLPPWPSLPTLSLKTSSRSNATGTSSTTFSSWTPSKLSASYPERFAASTAATLCPRMREDWCSATQTRTTDPQNIGWQCMSTENARVFWFVRTPSE